MSQSLSIFIDWQWISIELTTSLRLSRLLGNIGAGLTVLGVGGGGQGGLIFPLSVPCTPSSRRFLKGFLPLCAFAIAKNCAMLQNLFSISPGSRSAPLGYPIASFSSPASRRLSSPITPGFSSPCPPPRCWGVQGMSSYSSAHHAR